MKLSVDASGIEWNVALYLSQDAVGMQEVINGFDQHADNQRRFGLPERRIAKIFLFRLIYGGGAYSYANDPLFSSFSDRVEFWQGVIDQTYDKYRGLLKWHNELVAGVMASGHYESVSGRIYRFEPYKNRRGELTWPRTTILNYPVQGLAAEIMMLARIMLYRRMKAKAYKSLLVNTIHDNIEVDALPEEWYNILQDMKQVFNDLPETFEKTFGVKYNLPLNCEVSINGIKEKDWLLSLEK